MGVEHLEILRKLVRFDTVSRNSNLALIEWICDYLDGHGITVQLTYNPERSKANLFATIGDTSPGGLVLSGHTDVVPVDDQQWSSDPFTATLRDERIYGRGTCDMKGYIAVALSLVPELATSRRHRPIHLAFSFDEEIGCLGVRPLLSDLAAREIRPRGCVVGEPTGMRVVTAHKGAAMIACEITGLEVHSSLAPRGVNAIHYAALIIAQVDAIAHRLAAEEPPHPGFDIPHSTIQVNQIRGGTAGNTVAGGCRFTIDIRTLPGTRRESLLEQIRSYIESAILPRMRAVSPLCRIELNEIAQIPGFCIEREHELVQHVQRVLEPAQDPCCVAFATEAGLFQQAGIPTLICGPGHIDQAHRPDEFISLAQLERCGAVLRKLTRDVEPQRT